MTAAVRPCPRCKTPIENSSRFCGACGYLLSAEERASLEASAGGAAPQGTHPGPTGQGPPGFGTLPGQAPTDLETTVPGRPPDMFDTTAPGVGPGAPASPEGSSPFQDGTARGVGPAPGLAAQPASTNTVLGMPIMTAADVRPGPAPAAPVRAAPVAAIGAPPSQAQQSAAAFAATVQTPMVAPPPAQVSPISNRTMLGMPMQVANAMAAAAAAKAASQQAQAGPSPAPGPAPGQFPPAPAQGAQPMAARGGAFEPTNRTMLGMAMVPQGSVAPDPGAYAPSPGVPTTPGIKGPGFGAPGDPWVSSDSYEAPKKSSGLLLLLLIPVVLLILAGVGGGVFYYLSLHRGPTLHASVAQTDVGESLIVEVPGAAPGTKVRFGGTEHPLESGRAVFTLAADSLHLGQNDLAVDVVRPTGAVETASVRLTVSYRVRTDLGALAETVPAIAIVVEAPVGAQVLIDGTPVALLGGHATHRVNIADRQAGADGLVEIRSHYHIALPGGTAADGDVDVRVPPTTLVVDRPGTQLVTDRAEVEIAGAIDPQATLTLDGAAVPVHDGAFVVRRPLPALGPQGSSTQGFTLVAHAPGKAPARAVVTVRRVADLAAEARAYGADPSLTYGRLAQNANMYRGQKVHFEGRAFNVQVQGGHSMIQMLARECPRGVQCSLWVTYPAATDAVINSSVDVYGTVAGEQQYRAEASDRVNVVPHIEAAFVLVEGAGTP